MKRPDVILSIVAGLVVLAVSVTLAVQAVTGFFTPFSSSGPPIVTEPYEGPDGDFSDIAAGDPGSPAALVPTICPTACFTEDDLDTVGTDDFAFDGLGLTPSGSFGVDASMTDASVEHEIAVELWEGAGIFADECFFTSPVNPIVEPLIAVGVREDPIAHVAGGGANGASVEQWARVFPDTATATEYMAALDAGLQVCTRYKDENSYPTEVIIRQAALEVPESVAALGWVRKPMSTDDRFYVTDVQRANIVIRTVGYNDGTYTDELWREFMTDAAAQLGSYELP